LFIPGRGTRCLYRKFNPYLPLTHLSWSVFRSIVKSSAHDLLAQSVLAKKGQAKEKMDKEWKKSIDSPMQQLFEGDGPGYDNEDDAQYDADASSDGHSSCSQSSDIIGESGHGSFYEGVDTILNNLASQTNAAGVPQDGGDRVGAVTPSGDTKGLLGQHSSMSSTF
ncbi:hypothetical protein F5883DRAFT_205186, partial [Diaporthe sp. PMI_573]